MHLNNLYCTLLNFTTHSCLARPNELPRKYLIKYNFARVGKKRLSCQELTKNDPIVTVIVIEPKSGSDIEDKRQGFL